MYQRNQLRLSCLPEWTTIAQLRELLLQGDKEDNDKSKGAAPTFDSGNKAYFYNGSKVNSLVIEVRCSEATVVKIASRIGSMLDPEGPMRLDCSRYLKVCLFSMGLHTFEEWREKAEYEHQ